MNTSLSLSFELIYLIDWLLKNDKQKLTTLIQQAVSHGLAQDLKRINPNDYLKVSEELYSTILDFLVFLEDTLAENLKDLSASNTADNVMMPAIKKIDDENLNDATLRNSIQDAKDQLHKEREEGHEEAANVDHAKEVLYEKILENWLPTNKETMN